MLSLLLGPLGLAVLATVLIAAWVTSIAQGFVGRQLAGYWLGDDGTALYAPPGGKHLTLQVAGEKQGALYQAVMRAGWWAAARVALSGLDRVPFAIDGEEEVLVGGAPVASGVLEMGAGRLSLLDRSGAVLLRLMRDPTAATVASAAAAGADDDGDEI